MSRQAVPPEQGTFTVFYLYVIPDTPTLLSTRTRDFPSPGNTCGPDATSLRGAVQSEALPRTPSDTAAA